jgi:CRP-like cAMP-binding protein
MPLTRKIVGELNSSEIACLSDLQSDTVQFKRGTAFACECETSNRAFLLKSGWACCYKDLREGGRQIISFPLPGDFIGLSSILLKSSDHSVAAVTDVVVSRVNLASLMRLFEKFPRIAAAILWSASRDQAMVVEHLVDVGRRSSVERVAHWLLELRQRLLLVGLASETEFEFPLTQYDLADALGLSPIHVNRVLRHLRQQDFLVVKSHRAIVHNLAGLTELAGYESSHLHMATMTGGKSFSGSVNLLASEY